MHESAYIFIALFFWAFGMWLGSKMEAHKWRANANSIVRLESNGALYKVTKVSK